MSRGILRASRADDGRRVGGRRARRMSPASPAPKDSSHSAICDRPAPPCSNSRRRALSRRHRARMPDVCELPSRHRRTTPAPSPTSRLSNQTGALISFESPNADRDMIERRADHHRVDTATLDGSDGRRTRCEGRPCPAPGEPRIRRTTRRARTSAGPRSWWRAFARATPPVTSSRPGMKSLPLPEQRTTRSCSRIRPCEEFVRYPNAIGAARHFERPPRIVQDRTSGGSGTPACLRLPNGDPGIATALPAFDRMFS